MSNSLMFMFTDMVCFSVHFLFHPTLLLWQINLNMAHLTVLEHNTEHVVNLHQSGHSWTSS